MVMRQSEPFGARTLRTATRVRRVLEFNEDILNNPCLSRMLVLTKQFSNFTLVSAQRVKARSFSFRAKLLVGREIGNMGTENPRIIKGRPFGVRFECLLKLLQKGAPFYDQR